MKGVFRGSLGGGGLQGRVVRGSFVGAGFGEAATPVFFNTIHASRWLFFSRLPRDARRLGSSRARLFVAATLPRDGSLVAAATLPRDGPLVAAATLPTGQLRAPCCGCSTSQRRTPCCGCNTSERRAPCCGCNTSTGPLLRLQHFLETDPLLRLQHCLETPPPSQHNGYHHVSRRGSS